MSAIVESLTNKLGKMFGADHALIVFIPSPSYGLFYNFEAGQLFQLELATTIFEDMINAPDISSLTFPMSLGRSTTS